MQIQLIGLVQSQLIGLKCYCKERQTLNSREIFMLYRIIFGSNFIMVYSPRALLFL